MRKKLACAIFGMALLYGVPLRPQNASQAADDPARSNTAQEPSPVSATPLSEERAPAEKKDSRAARRDYEALGFYVNLTLTLATLVIAVTAAIQASAAKSTAKSQMDADRAWVLVSVVGQPKEPLIKSLMEEGIVPGIVWKIEIFGNTPARIVSEKYRCHTVLIDKGVNPAAPTLNDPPLYLPSAEGAAHAGVVYPPGHQHHLSVALEPDPGGSRAIEQLSAVSLGATAFCAYGRIDYEDTFGRQGITQFCAIYRPQRGGVIESPDGTKLNPPGFYIGGPSGYNYNT